MTSSVLADTSFLIALADPADKYRDQALAYAKTSSDTRVIPVVALVEVTHILRRFIGHQASATFLRTVVNSGAQIEYMTPADLKRAVAIMEKHADSRLDFVDCCIMALTERLKITQVLTFDRRDFPIFRPAHCEYLQLLP